MDDASGNLVARWRAGDQEAAAELFRRYTSRLVALARSRLPAQLAPRLDPEDVVQSVYRSFFADARAGRFDLPHGGDLWRLLVGIMLHKLHHQIRDNRAGKRAIERERAGNADELPSIPARLLAREPSPAEAAALTDELQQVMDRLKPFQRRVLELRLQGYTIEEIAADSERSERRVYCVLEQVKQQLQERHCENADL